MDLAVIKPSKVWRNECWRSGLILLYSFDPSKIVTTIFSKAKCMLSIMAKSWISKPRSIKKYKRKSIEGEQTRKSLLVYYQVLTLVDEEATIRFFIAAVVLSETLAAAKSGLVDVKKRINSNCMWKRTLQYRFISYYIPLHLQFSLIPLLCLKGSITNMSVLIVQKRVLKMKKSALIPEWQHYKERTGKLYGHFYPIMFQNQNTGSPTPWTSVLPTFLVYQFLGIQINTT